MPNGPTTLSEWRATIFGALGLMAISALAFYGLSRVDNRQSGDTLGSLATIGLAVWMLLQIWLYLTQVKTARQQLLIMGISFIQVVPFLFAAVYGAFGYVGHCVKGATGPTDLLYFSYVTFTTVGFGDLQPIGMCRAIAVAEAVTGYILLGLFVAAAVAVFQRTHQPHA